MAVVHICDYVAGNTQSLINAVERVGYAVELVRKPDDVLRAERLIVPGVGHYGHCLTQLAKGGYVDVIKQHLHSNKPFLGICVGLQALFDGSAEDPNVHGFSLVPGQLERFDDSIKSVPHIGWNSIHTVDPGAACKEGLNTLTSERNYYFVHSYAAPYQRSVLENQGWTVMTCRYGNEEFVAAMSRGNTFATQFHPEKSGGAGLHFIECFLKGNFPALSPGPTVASSRVGLTRRIVACLDVRANDDGDLIVTKGDQYDVRDRAAETAGQVRNLGKPVGLAQRYYDQGADEVTFLNITSFRNCPLTDLPMMEVLRQACKTVFVPLTVGGGIQDSVDHEGVHVSAFEVAAMYFKSGADKVSIGSAAVTAVEDYIRRGYKLSGQSSIETISAAYGNQAVVVSVDPRRVYVESPSATAHHTLSTEFPGPGGERFCWYQCTTKGGREGRDIDVHQLVTAVEAMGAGEILLNCIDKDGSKNGFDLELIKDVKGSIKIPVIASSGAGRPQHFTEVFEATTADAALGAGMFHRGEYTIKQVKDELQKAGLNVRNFDAHPG